jgi:quinoprotein glucose dehydrogenase
VPERVWAGRARPEFPPSPTAAMPLSPSSPVPSLLNARRFGSFSLLAAALACSPLLPGPGPTGGALAAQSGAVSEWRYWGGDAGSTRFSALDQIHPGNAGELEVAWRWTSANFGPDPETYYRATPLYADGRLFTVAGTRRAVVALDPSTGETLWSWRMEEGPRWEEAPRRFSGRGLAYWGEGAAARVYVTTPGYRLVALDPATGVPDPAFGVDGVVDLKEGLGFPVDPLTGIAEGEIGSGSPPIVSRGVVVVGGTHLPGTFPRAKRNIPGHIRGYDARTGALLWTFHTIPRPGEFGHDTWEEGSWEYTGKVAAWATLSVDEELGLVYLPMGAPTNDYYGGHRLGDNLFSQSLLVLDVTTGERVWHQQFIRHDLWDWDLPTAPTLVDITVDGRRIPAVAQATKQSWLYVFDRRTGEPVWPMEERPVPPSDVPGERAAPTQPFPTWPLPYDRQGVQEHDLIDFTPELRAEALELVKGYRLGPIFTPPSLAEDPSGSRGTLVAPGAFGGTDIMGGAAVNPRTGVMFVASIGGFSRLALEHNPDRSEMDYVSTGAGGIAGPQGLPLLKPPYGRITAIDLNTGEHLWMVPNGETPERIRNHPALVGVEIPATGKQAHATLLALPRVLVAGEGRGGDPLMRVLDPATGAELARLELPAPTNAAPMTFLHEGVQYVVVAVASGQVPGELVAIRLR